MNDQQDDKNDGDEASSTTTHLHTDDVASFLDLQTEFIKRRDAALAGKQIIGESSQKPTNFVHKTKNNILAISKEEKRTKQEVSIRRTQRIRENEEMLRKEEQQRQMQRKVLEHKAAIYERMSHGEKLAYEDGREAEFLVDFNTKTRESAVSRKRESRDNEGDSTDEEMKRSDDEREKKWEDQGPLIVHYDPTEEKGRVFGASHVPLPTMNEDEREKKIAELKLMTEQTKQERIKRKKQRDLRNIEERQRLNSLRKSMGLPPEESSEEEDEEEIEGKNELETGPQVANIPLPPEKEVDNESGPEEKKPRKYGVREWDRGKVGYMRWIEAQREERDEDFAPPTFYHQKDKRGK